MKSLVFMVVILPALLGQVKPDASGWPKHYQESSGKKYEFQDYALVSPLGRTLEFSPDAPEQQSHNVQEDQYGGLDISQNLIAPDQDSKKKFRIKERKQKLTYNNSEKDDASDRLSEVSLDKFLEHGTDLSTYWLIIKSFAERTIAYADKEFSLPSLKNVLPYDLYNRIISVGDTINQFSVWAGELDPEFVEHIVTKIEDNDSFNITRGLAGVVVKFVIDELREFFSSNTFNLILERFLDALSSYIGNSYSRASFQDYVNFMVPNSSIAHEILLASLPAEGQKYEPGSLSKTLHNIRDDVLRKKRSTLTDDYIDKYAIRDNVVTDRDTRSTVNRDGGYGGGYGGAGYGGYGGGGGGGYGGYGGMSYIPIDPFALLASLALGALLGFLLFAALNPTLFAGREVDDDHNLLWLSDIPEAISSIMHLPGIHDETGRERRDAGNTNSSGPGRREFFDSGTDSDPVDRLNELWTIYKHSQNKKFCISEHLCKEISSIPPEILAGTRSASAIVLATATSLLGVSGAGQMLDSITDASIHGGRLSCPSTFQCLR